MATPSNPSTPSKPRRPSSSLPAHPRRARAASALETPGANAFVLHQQGLASIRTFLKGRSSYDVFPVSFRLIVLDTKLTVKKALGVMLQTGVISAPLWNSEKSSFAGMLTVSDLIHLIQYYYHTQTYEGAAADVEHFRLESLREIERELSVPPPPLLSVHPLNPLFEASKLLHQTHARRLPLIDRDDQTGGEVVLSVLTQYRVLKFIAVNCPAILSLHLPLQACKIGTYVASEGKRPPGPISPFWPLATATLQTTVFDVVHMFSERGISSVPIIDDRGIVINLYETVDVITLVRLGAYTSLDLTISQALARRSPDFPGVVTCTPQDSLANLFQLIRKRRLHRLVVVEPEGPNKGRLVGFISLNDVLRYVIDEEVPVAPGGSGDSSLSESASSCANGGGQATEATSGDVPRVVINDGEAEEEQQKEQQQVAKENAAVGEETTTPPSPPPMALPSLQSMVAGATAMTGVTTATAQGETSAGQNEEG